MHDSLCTLGELSFMCSLVILFFLQYDSGVVKMSVQVTLASLAKFVVCKLAIHFNSPPCYISLINKETLSVTCTCVMHHSIISSYECSNIRIQHLIVRAVQMIMVLYYCCN